MRSHPAQSSQLAKPTICSETRPNSILSDITHRIKRKRSEDDVLDSLWFFRGTVFASPHLALTISSPETTASVPKQRPGYLNRGSPPRSPLVARPFFFLTN